MNSTDSLIDLLVANVRERGYRDLPADAIENAKNRIIDVLGCLIRGWGAPGNPALVDLIKGWGGREEATILVYGGRVPAANAAMANSILARSLDYEPCLVFLGNESVPSHISATTVSVAMTLGEAMGINGEELITAIILGDDLTCRILTSADYGLNNPWDCTGTVNAFGATAIAGKILGLTAKQLKYALGIVLNQLGGTFQSIWEGTTSFKLMQGLSARNGILANELAKAGWTGPEDALFGPCGYYKVYTGGCTNAEMLTNNLGKIFYSEATFKPYPSCRGIHPSLDCILEIVSAHHVAPEEVEQVIVYLPRADTFISQPFKPNDSSPQASAFFNLSYVMANALIHKSVKPEHFYAPVIQDEAVIQFAQKVHVKELPDVESETMADAEFRLARVTIKTRNGQEYTASTNTPKGEPITNPFTRSDLVSKFMENVKGSGVITESSGAKLIALLERLETVQNVNELTELLLPGMQRRSCRS